MSRFLPPDHSLGDEATIGGYERVHARPAALEGPDGFSYSVAVLSDQVDPAGSGAARDDAFGAYLLFVRWRRIGEEGVEGHVESAFLEFGASREAALQRLRDWRIERVQKQLNTLLSDTLRSDEPTASEATE